MAMIKNRSRLAPTLLLLVSAVIAVGQSQLTETQARVELTAVLLARNEALERGDSARVRAFYGPNFVMRAGDTTLTIKEIDQLSGIAEGLTVLDRKYTSLIEELKIKNDAVVLVVEHQAFEKVQLKDGSVREHRNTKRQKETWAKQGNDWLLHFVDDIKVKQSEVLVNGKPVHDVVYVAAPMTFTITDEPQVAPGDGLVFIYRIKDFAIIKSAVYVNDEKLAQLTGGSFIKVKLSPGTYSFRSDKGEPIDVAVEAGKIQFLAVKLETGFPKGRGRLSVDNTVLGPQAYKVPKTLQLNPLGDDNIFDRTRVVSTKP